MANYVDGFVVPVPVANLDAYMRLSRRMGKVWMEYGALAYTECVADDVPPGKLTSFPMSVKLKDGEVVVFSWIVFKSRKHRDTVNAKVMADARLPKDMSAMPFDTKRMIWGGFQAKVAL